MGAFIPSTSSSRIYREILVKSGNKATRHAVKPVILGALKDIDATAFAKVLEEIDDGYDHNTIVWANGPEVKIYADGDWKDVLWDADRMTKGAYLQP